MTRVVLSSKPVRQSVVLGERGGEVRRRGGERRVRRGAPGRRLVARALRLRPLLVRLGPRLPLDLAVRRRYY